MVHFTCDLCGKDMTASGDPRYVVKIEAYAGFDPTEITEEDLDEDHMEEVSAAPAGDDRHLVPRDSPHPFIGKASDSICARHVTSDSSRIRWARNSSGRLISARIKGSTCLEYRSMLGTGVQTPGLGSILSGKTFLRLLTPPRRLFGLRSERTYGVRKALAEIL